jgi:type II secretory pathway pseudopilin PulG
MPSAPRSGPPRSSSRNSGFTLVELLITACLFIIVLGLAVSLSRHVRAQSARVLTGDLLVRMEVLLDRYTASHGRLEIRPEFFPVADSATTAPSAGSAALQTPGSSSAVAEKPHLDEAQLLRLALRNNRSFLMAVSASTPPEYFAQLGVSVYDPSTPSLRDAWGTPVVYIPRTHPMLGMAPRDAPFFLSAGPDRKFLTLGDNLYSYEAFPRPD